MNRIVPLIFVFITLSAHSAISPDRLKNISPKIRVKIAGKLQKVLVSGLDLKKILFLNYSKKEYPGRKRLKFNCDKISQVLRKKTPVGKPLLLASINSPTGLISFEDQKFQGKLHILGSRKNNECDVINETNIENYISSLLSKEMNKVWPLEALKAQAVAARSYAVYKMISKQVSKSAGHETYYDLESSEKHQVTGDFFDANNITYKAALGTEGQVLVTDKGKLVPIFFHAKCGGKTLRPDQVWENEIAGYIKRDCPFCHDHGRPGWEKKLTHAQIYKFVAWLKKKNYIESRQISDKIRFVNDSFKKDVLRMYIGDEIFILKKAFFRRYFGRNLFPSNNFNLTPIAGGLAFKGEGLGHGVGMCQLGALDMAQKGMSYKKILSHYFPNHKLEKIY